jgi:hypothetical protein
MPVAALGAALPGHPYDHAIESDVEFPENLEMVVNEEVYDAGAVKTYACFPEISKIAGALLEAVVIGAGFQDFAIRWRKDVFSNTPQQISAIKFGTLGITFMARKP